MCQILSVENPEWNLLCCFLAMPTDSTKVSNELQFCDACTEEAVNDVALQSIESVDIVKLPLISDTHAHNPSFSVVLSVISCQQCHNGVSVWYKDAWHSPEDLLFCGTESRDGILEVASPMDFLALFVLSQFFHNQHDIDLSTDESLFTPPSLNSLSKIAWSHGHAVGFYTLLRKGTSFPQSPLIRSHIDMVDTMYVRRTHRRGGLASKFLDDILLQFPVVLIGFTEPLSSALLKVLECYMKKHPKCQDLFWACSFTGEPGYRWNVHLRLKTERYRANHV